MQIYLNAAFSILIFILLIKNGRRNLHIFQQNSYRIARFLRWAKKHPFRAGLWKLIVFSNALVLFLLGLDTIAYFTFIAFILLLIFIRSKTREKKPLVFTQRAIRLYVANILFAAAFAAWFYLRQPVCPYPIFIAGVIAAAFSWLPLMLAALILWPVEYGINRWFFNDARKKIKSMPNLRVIGITGSYGKTSTKYFLQTILREHFLSLMTPDSYNTPMGITRVARSTLKPIHEVFITEMGARQRGDIRELCTLASPEAGILTAIGEQHLETFKCLDNIIKTKFELIENLSPTGFAVLNGDDPNIRNHQAKSDVRKIYYGISSEPLDYTCRNVKITDRGTSFDFVNVKTGVSFPVSTRLLGRHNVHNLLAAISVATELGVPAKKITKATQKIDPVPHRLEIRKNDIYTVIDDAFNSNPIGAGYALEALRDISGKTKILITPGMVELGKKEYEHNYNFGKQAAKAADIIILVGKKQTAPIQAGLQDAEFDSSRLHVVNKLEEALAIMNRIVQKGDVVLFENDLPDTYIE